eukprot:g11303.t1
MAAKKRAVEDGHGSLKDLNLTTEEIREIFQNHIYTRFIGLNFTDAGGEKKDFLWQENEFCDSFAGPASPASPGGGSSTSFREFYDDLLLKAYVRDGEEQDHAKKGACTAAYYDHHDHHSTRAATASTTQEDQIYTVQYLLYDGQRPPGLGDRLLLLIESAAVALTLESSTEFQRRLRDLFAVSATFRVQIVTYWLPLKKCIHVYISRPRIFDVDVVTNKLSIHRGMGAEEFFRVFPNLPKNLVFLPSEQAMWEYLDRSQSTFGAFREALGDSEFVGVSNAANDWRTELVPKTLWFAEKREEFVQKRGERFVDLPSSEHEQARHPIIESQSIIGANNKTILLDLMQQMDLFTPPQHGTHPEKRFWEWLRTSWGKLYFDRDYFCFLERFLFMASKVQASAAALREVVLGAGGDSTSASESPALPFVAVHVRVGDLQSDNDHDMWLRANVLNELDRVVHALRAAPFAYNFSASFRALPWTVVGDSAPHLRSFQHYLQRKLNVTVVASSTILQQALQLTAPQELPAAYAPLADAFLLSAVAASLGSLRLPYGWTAFASTAALLNWNRSAHRYPVPILSLHKLWMDRDRYRYAQYERANSMTGRSSDGERLEAVKVGGTVDGGKWVCDPHRIPRPVSEPEPTDGSDPSCLVYSVGSNFDFGFEMGVLAGISPRCEIHVFDPLLVCNGNLWGQHEYNTKKVLSLPGIRQLLNHTNSEIDILKIDCETCEWSVFSDVFGIGGVEGDFPESPHLYPPRQVLMEVHEGTV